MAVGCRGHGLEPNGQEENQTCKQTNNCFQSVGIRRLEHSVLLIAKQMPLNLQYVFSGSWAMKGSERRGAFPEGAQLPRGRAGPGSLSLALSHCPALSNEPREETPADPG